MPFLITLLVIALIVAFLFLSTLNIPAIMHLQTTS